MTVQANATLNVKLEANGQPLCLTANEVKVIGGHCAAKHRRTLTAEQLSRERLHD
jgi:hypothetical protein